MYSDYTINVDPEDYKLRIIDFLGQFDHAVILDSNSAFGAPIPVTGCTYDFIAAAGVYEEIDSGDVSLDELQVFLDRQAAGKNWVFGFLSYDIKNKIENLSSGNPSFVSFPELHFFVPKHIIIAKNSSIKIISTASDPSLIWEEINSFPSTNSEVREVKISYVHPRDSYLAAVQNILSHIRYGDIYELNFCHEVRLNTEGFNGTEYFKKLTAISPNPFSAYYKIGSYHLLCASPERFVKKQGEKLITQPIKGTTERSDDPDIDKQNREFLARNEKERSENVMIVDLVRNDLSKVAQKGSVRVDELFGVYTFRKAHQMISTVSCNAKPQTTFTDVIRSAFPMGSMTGAPKVSAMKLIEKYENFRRGLFSGTVGYIDPEGNFDFNVIIRSILCNERNGHISIAAGGAITAASDPEKEYRETLVKIAPQLSALGFDVKKLLNFNDVLNHV